MRGVSIFAMVRTFLLLIPLTAAWGCSNPSPPPVAYCPTSGSVAYNDKPPAGAIITFHPVAAGEGSNDSNEPTVKIQVKVQKDGTFRLDGETKEDGLLPGVYALTITWSPNAACPTCFAADTTMKRRRSSGRPSKKAPTSYR